MIEKIPPHSKTAEESVLGAAMLSQDSLSDIVGIVSPKDFYEQSNRLIFETIVELFEESVPVDFVTVVERIDKKKILEKVGGRSYIATLTSNVPITSNAAEYAKIVAEKASLRRLCSTADMIKEMSYDESKPADDILDMAESEIFKISQEKQHSPYSHIKEILPENVARINAAKDAKDGITGVSTGFVDLDRQLSGLHKSDLIIIAARPAMGKTAFSLSLALNAAKKSKASVLLFSLEMSKPQITERFMSMEASVEMEKIKKGTLDESEWKQLFIAIDQLSKYNIHIDDTANIKMMEIKNKCRRLKAEKGLDLILIDYLQLMTGDGRSESRQQEVSALSRSLKLLAREMDCPVIALSQLSRGLESRQDKRPMLSDLRESGAIEQDADIVIFLYRDEYYNEESEKKGLCEVITAKHRNGETGTVELAWVAKYTKFGNKAENATVEF